jgi:hypothetical protein
MKAGAPRAGLVARIWLRFLLFSWAVCVDPSMTRSGFIEYCAAFAQVTASRKTGQTTGVVELDDGWHRAYSQALDTCSQGYERRSARPQNTDAELISHVVRGKVRRAIEPRSTKLQVAPHPKQKAKSAKKASKRIKSKSGVGKRKRVRILREPGDTTTRRIGQARPRVRRGSEHSAP